MSGSYPAARIKELLLDLICKLDPGHGQEHLHRAVHKYAAALQNHKYLSIIDKDVDKSFTGIREKLAITGRVKESMILSLSRDKFMERHAQARDKCIACDLTDGSGIPIPQCMLKLLLCLADTPTAIGKHVPIDELMDAERLLAQPVLPVFIEQGEPDKEEDVLTYTAWRDMCNVESSDDEADEAWLAEEVMDEPIALKDRVEPKAVPVRTADTDSEDGDVSHGKNSDGSEFEYLRYGAHISQYDTTVEICGPETMQSISKGCVHMQNLSQAHEHAMVIANSDVCRMILQTILGFQNDFFIFSSEGESDRVPRWIRSVTAGRSCLASCSVTVTGHLLEWFLGLADDVQYCRSIASAAIGACAAPISRRTRRHAPCSGFTMFDAAGMLTADVAACSAVCCDALLPLYAAAHSQCEALAEYVSGLERQLAAGPQGSGTALPTALTLHISMQSHRRLFAAVRAMIESTRAAYAHCLTQSAHGMTSGTNGSLRVNRRLYTPNSLGGGIDQADPDYHDFSMERSVLSALTQSLLADINLAWYCSTSDLSASTGLETTAIPSGPSYLSFYTDDGSDSDHRSSFESSWTKESGLRLSPEDISMISGGRSQDITYLFSVGVLVALLRSELALMVTAHAVVDGSRVSDSVRIEAFENEHTIFDAHIQQLWSSSRQSQKEFELVSRIPAVLGSLRAGKELRGEGAVTGVFREIGDLVCENLSAVLIGQRHNVTVNNDFISCAVKEDRIDNSAPAIAVLRKERHPLFQNTTEELMEALQIDLSRRCEIQSDGSQLLSTPTRSYFNGLSVISASAVLRASVVGPLIAAINRTSAAAASALVRVPRLLSTAEGGDSGERLSKGFMLMHHMEYLRMLFLMGGETIRPWGPIATDSSADPTQSHWQQSPGAVFVSLQEAYCVLLDRKIQRQHESINVMARGEINPMSDARGTDFMAFSPELYTLSQGMLSQLMASLPIHEAAHHASSAGSEGLSTGTSVGVAVSFRPGGGTDFRTSEATAVKPSSPWASAAVAALLSDHLAVELYYPFPLNKVITPVVIKRLRSVLMELLNITTLRWAVESTWKLDKISKAVFEKVIIGYKGAGEVLVLKKCLDRCRVSLSWLVHTIRGILYYFMSEIHDILWARLCEDMQMASQISITKQGIAVELFVAHVQGLLSLYEISISALLAKGHAAVSAYQLALLAMRDVCNCSQQESATEISLDSSRTPLLVAKCVAALKRADLEFAALRISLGDFLDVLGSLGGDGSRSISGSRVWNAGMAGIVNAADRMASGGEWNREASRAFAVNEARRLNAILGGAWNSYK